MGHGDIPARRSWTLGEATERSSRKGAVPGLPDILPSPMRLSQPSVGTGGAEPCLGAEAPPASGHALGSR